jgi:hypothetical protein
MNRVLDILLVAIIVAVALRYVLIALGPKRWRRWLSPRSAKDGEIRIPLAKIGRRRP